MNSFTKSLRPPEQKKKIMISGGKSFFVPFAFKFLLFAAGFFGIITYRIYLNEKAEELNREASAIQLKIHKLNREIANLKIEKERLSSWAYVGGRIKDYNLALRPATSDQIRSINIIGPKGYGGSGMASAVVAPETVLPVSRKSPARTTQNSSSSKISRM